MALAEKKSKRSLPGDELVTKLQRGWTGLRPYRSPEGTGLSWWDRWKQAKLLREEARKSLQPNIIHTPPRGVQPK